MDFNIGELHRNTPHLFADLVELILTTDYNGRTSLHKTDLINLLENGNISVDEIDQEDDAEEEANSTHQSSAEKMSRSDKQLEDVFTHLTYRSDVLNSYYPFSMDGNKVILDKNTLTEKQRVYRFLLACSRLRSFEDNGIRQEWAKAFTNLSKVAMCGLVPKNAIVHIFDANSDDRRNHYSTDLREALKILGKNLAVLNINEKECNNAGASGDAGLDIVAIVNFDDGAATSLAMFGQCGAQETEWPKKTLEAHWFNYANFFHMIKFDYPNIMFTPVCYRTAGGGEWADNKSANGVLLIDRERILKLLDAQNSWNQIVQSAWFLKFETKFSTVRTYD